MNLKTTDMNRLIETLGIRSLAGGNESGEPLVRIFHQMKAGNPAEGQHHAKDFQIRRHRTDIG